MKVEGARKERTQRERRKRWEERMRTGPFRVILLPTPHFTNRKKKGYKATIVKVTPLIWCRTRSLNRHPRLPILLTV